MGNRRYHHKKGSKAPYALALGIIVLVAAFLYQNNWVVPEVKIDTGNPSCPNGFLYSAIPDPINGVCIPVQTASGSGGGGGSTDTTDPTVAISSPSNNQELSSGTKTTTITGTASDDKSLALVEIAVNSGQFVVATGTTSWSATVQNLADGQTYTITVRATDSSGNTQSDSILFKVKSPIIIQPVADISDYRGVNYQSPVLRTGPSSEVSNVADISKRMQALAADGLNFIRVNIYWDHYERNPSQTLLEVENIVREAGKRGIDVQLDFHHFHTGAFNGGDGFPTRYTADYPLDNNQPRTSDKAWRFWQAYVYEDVPGDNAGQSIWDDQWKYMDAIMRAAQKGNSAGNWVAVEWLNEPQIPPPKSGDTVDDVYRQYGRMNQEFSDKLRAASYYNGQFVVVCEANGIGDQASKIGAQHLAMPKGVKTIYAFHRYNSPLDEEFGTRSVNVVNAAKGIGVDIQGRMLQEWALGGTGFGFTEADMRTWMSKLKQYDIAWTYWAAFGGNDNRNLYRETANGDYVHNDPSGIHFAKVYPEFYN